jgi:3-isopropylmalate/(R)-2-methylmalate dehydratase small subunit
MERANVDTDQIIPKQFLKSIQRTGFGTSLFFDWRYDEAGNPDPGFELNEERFRNATILVVRQNFGCGSSREHAVWALTQYGFAAVVAPVRGEGDQRIPGFADIFRNNAVKNGLLTIELTEAEVQAIFEWVERFPGLEATIDLEEQRVVFHLDEEESFPFEIDPAVKDTLIRGLDDIAMTLEHADAIAAFELRHDTQLVTS